MEERGHPHPRWQNANLVPSGQQTPDLRWFGEVSANGRQVPIAMESCVGPGANDTTFRVRALEVGDLGNGRRWGPDGDQWVTSVEDHRGGGQCCRGRVGQGLEFGPEKQMEHVPGLPSRKRQILQFGLRGFLQEVFKVLQHEAGDPRSFLSVSQEEFLSASQRPSSQVCFHRLSRPRQEIVHSELRRASKTAAQGARSRCVWAAGDTALRGRSRCAVRQGPPRRAARDTLAGHRRRCAGRQEG